MARHRLACEPAAPGGRARSLAPAEDDATPKTRYTGAVDAGQTGRARPTAIAGEALLARLEESRGGGDAIVAFDADGTLWSGDVGIDLFEALLEQRAVRPAARERLAADARAIGLRAEGDANEIARSLYAAFDEERYPEERAFAMMAWAFAGFRPDELAAFAAAVALDRGLASRVRPAVLPLLSWARGAGLDVYVVSGSARAIVEIGALQLGIPASHVLAMTPAVDDGLLAPRIAGAVVYADGKRVALRAARPSADLVAAFGDSGYDAALLREARIRVAIDPKPSLLRIAHTIPELFELTE